MRIAPEAKTVHGQRASMCAALLLFSVVGKHFWNKGDHGEEHVEKRHT